MVRGGRVLRSCAFGTVGFVLSAALALSVGLARLREDLARAGAALLPRAASDATAPDAPRTLRFNGARLRFASGATRDGVSEVLAAFRERCRGRIAPTLPSPFDASVGTHDERAGYLGCVDFGMPAVAVPALFARTRAFLTSGDFAAIGNLHVAWARRMESVTTYVAIWSEGSLPLRAMFPPSGDAPGDDLAVFPRPPSARRVISAQADGETPRIVAYLCASELATCAERYARTLRAAGFELQRIEHGRTWFARRGADAAAVSLRAADDRATFVAIVPL